ncbi:MAG: hypothetical protein J6V72_19560, partial [Kiritimatiellae bacterium]|nr:hypothetical protein [Kiritimatiellia bacterium]
ATHGEACDTAAETAAPHIAAPRMESRHLGGDKMTDQGTAFYRTRRDADGRWWFVDPNGKRFFLAGAGTVNSSGDYNAKLGYATYGRAVAR